MNPEPNDSKTLQGSNYLRIRVGDYRIIYEIKRNKLYILIITIGHPRDVYEKLKNNK